MFNQRHYSPYRVVRKECTFLYDGYEKGTIDLESQRGEGYPMSDIRKEIKEKLNNGHKSSAPPGLLSAEYRIPGTFSCHMREYVSIGEIQLHLHKIQARSKAVRDNPFRREPESFEKRAAVLRRLDRHHRILRLRRDSPQSLGQKLSAEPAAVKVAADHSPAENSH